MPHHRPGYIALLPSHDGQQLTKKATGLAPKILRSPRLRGAYDAIRFWGYLNPYRPGTDDHAAYLAAWKESTIQEHEELRNNPRAIENRKPSAALGSHGSVCDD